MRTTFLETPSDMKWLAAWHVPTAELYACAILHGNEDCPDKVELFKVNDIRTTPTVMVRDPETGEWVETTAIDRQE